MNSIYGTFSDEETKMMTPKNRWNPAAPFAADYGCQFDELLISSNRGAFFGSPSVCVGPNNCYSFEFKFVFSAVLVCMAGGTLAAARRA